MAENKNDFNETVASLFKGMDSFLSAKTVVGEAVHVNDTIILPLVDVSFGVGAGAFAGDKKNNAGGGMGGKMSPSAVLVIQNGATKLVNIKNQDTVTKILDMVPDVVDRITGKFGDVKMDDDIDEAISLSDRIYVLSTKPAMVKKEFTVDEISKNNPEKRASLKSEILSLLT